MTPATAPDGFAGLGIAPKLLTILQRLHFSTPTPIQQRAIPIAASGKDIIGVAQTGTGKTLAFGLPVIQCLAKMPGVQALIVLPTRELTQQVDETLQQVGTQVGLRTAMIIGGESMHLQLQRLRRKPHVIIATPGRLLDHMKQKTITLQAVKIVVLDEADRMFDMGFAPQLHQILKHVPTPHQTMLFSATMPAPIVQLATSYMELPLRVEVAPAGTTAAGVEQEMIIVQKTDKATVVEKLLRECSGRVLVFSRTKHGAKRICASLRDSGYKVAEIHSNRSLAQRRAAMAGFKTGKHQILVATDIAARGIDVTDIALVINYDLPDNPEDYVHRIGRTGRAGKTGKAISLATPDQRVDIRRIERLIQRNLPLTKLTEFAPEKIVYKSSQRRRRGGSGGFHQRRRR